MPETHGYIKILPDSTGKRIPQTVMAELNYDNGTIPFLRGDVIVSSVSNITGTIYEVEGTTTSGLFHLKIQEPVPATISYILGENLSVNNVVRAKVASVGYPFYFQQTNIVGFSNPLNGWDIDEYGSGSVTFPEGSPTFDAFGKMLVATQVTMAEYLNKYEKDLDRFSESIAGTASVTHDPTTASLVFSTGTTIGDKAERISDQYHPYQLGKSRLSEYTIAIGDSGKTGVNRFWGYADDNDGLLFAVIDTIFYVVLRSSVPGMPAVTYYPQAEWNGDRLDGSKSVYNSSGMQLDITKGNIYWVDFQWLGMGKVRFGVISPEGKRITCHTIKNANKNSRPYMRTGTLPVYFEQINTGVPVSSSEMRLTCCVVKQGGEFSPSMKHYAITTAKNITATSNVPLVSFRSKQTVNNIDNRISSFIDSISGFSSSAIQVSVFDNVTLTGDTFANNTGKGTEFDTAATSFSGGKLIKSFFISAGQDKEINMSELFNFMGHSIRRKAEIVNADVVTIAIRLISAGSSSTELTVTLSDV